MEGSSIIWNATVMALQRLYDRVLGGTIFAVHKQNSATLHSCISSLHLTFHTWVHNFWLAFVTTSKIVLAYSWPFLDKLHFQGKTETAQISSSEYLANQQPGTQQFIQYLFFILEQEATAWGAGRCLLIWLLYKFVMAQVTTQQPSLVGVFAPTFVSGFPLPEIWQPYPNLPHTYQPILSPQGRASAA